MRDTLLAGALLLFGWAGVVFAAPVAVDVVSVRFNEPRLPGQSYPWQETAITLRPVKTNVENVVVQLTLRFRDNTPGSKKGSSTQTFTGKVRLYGLERNAVVRFYLPPDLARIRRLSQTPEVYLISLSSSYGTEPFDRAQASPSLGNPAERSALGAATGGLMLLPHYNTPFYSLSETFRDLPSYVVP